MQTLTNPLFWVGLFQSPLLFCFLNWATRDSGQFDIDPMKFVIAVVGGSAILALPLWILGELPIHAGTGPGAQAWFFGFVLGAVPTGIVRWIGGERPLEIAPADRPGRCPYCGRFPGFANVLVSPPTRPFQCAHCRRSVVIDPSRVLYGFAIVYIPLAIYIVGWGAPDEIPSWAPWVFSILPFLPYPFIVKVVPAES